MAFLKTTYRCFYKRPFLIIYVAAFSLLFSIFQLFNPLIGLLQNLGAIRSESWTDSMIYISKELYTFPNLSYIIPIIALLGLILAVISGVLTSGFMNLYYETLMENSRKTLDLIIQGIKKFFLKVSLIYLQFYLFVFAIILMIPIAMVPSIILAEKAIENGSSNIFTTGFLTILTLIIIFFMLVFTAMAFLYRFPSVFYFKKRPIEKAKSVVSSAFWRYFAPVCLLVVLFIGSELVLIGIKSKILELFAGWIFHTLLLIAVSAVAFTGFAMMLRKFKRD